MDSYDQMQQDRARRNAAVVAELSAVCRLHGATASYEPTHGIYVVVSEGVRIEWQWSLTARAAHIDITEIGSRGTHPKLAPADQAPGFARLAGLLADPAFEIALAIALTRTSADSARALTLYQQRRAAIEAPQKWTGD